VSVQARRIAPDDVRDRLSPLIKSSLQTGGNRGNVVVQPARRDQGAHGQRERQPAERQSDANLLHGKANQHARADHQPAGQPPTPRLVRRGCRGIKPALLELGDRIPHRHDRVRHSTPEPPGIANESIEGERQE
jgi:hypothetical protein